MIKLLNKLFGKKPKRYSEDIEIEKISRFYENNPTAVMCIDTKQVYIMDCLIIGYYLACATKWDEEQGRYIIKEPKQHKWFEVRREFEFIPIDKKVELPF